MEDEYPSYEPTGPTCDDLEDYDNWEPVEFERWFYGKIQKDEYDQFMEFAFEMEEEQRLSIDD